MSAPSSRHLSHDFPTYKGLTLRELMMLSFITTSSFLLLFVVIGFLLQCPVALGCVGFLTGFIVSLTVLPKPLARLKEGKPPNQIQKLVYQKLAGMGFIKSPWMHHTGPWQKTRRVGGRDV